MMTTELCVQSTTSTRFCSRPCTRTSERETEALSIHRPVCLAVRQKPAKPTAYSYTDVYEGTMRQCGSRQRAGWTRHRGQICKATRPHICRININIETRRRG